MFAVTRVWIFSALLLAAVFGLSFTEEHNRDRLSVSESRDPLNRIFGGQSAKKGQIPYIVSVRILPLFLRHICGGSIISNRFVLTVAHCHVKLYPAPTQYRVLAGTHEDHHRNGVLYKVNRIIVHEEFYQNQTGNIAIIRNDIALIETVQTIQFNLFVAPIELHHKFIGSGARALSSGWGDTGDPKESPYLKYVQLTTLTNGKCREIYQRKHLNAPVHDWDTLCSYPIERLNGVCEGDLGGPLVSERKLIGVSSWALGCGNGFPNGFTRISTYIEWINKNAVVKS